MSNKAETDIRKIAEQSLRSWGIARADRYIRNLHATFHIAGIPNSGTDMNPIRKGCLRTTADRHVVFYRATNDGIFILRILHQRMDFVRHLYAACHVDRRHLTGRNRHLAVSTLLPPMLSIRATQVTRNRRVHQG